MAIQPTMSVQKRDNDTNCRFQRAFLCYGPYLDQLLHELFQAIEDIPDETVVLSFSGAEFVGSEMLGKMIAMHSFSRSIGKRLLLIDMSAAIRMSFAVTQVDLLFEIQDEKKEVESH